MSDERKNAGVWPWIVAPLIGVPVLYVASFGPACWLVVRDVVPVRPVEAVYRPILAIEELRLGPVSDALAWYAGIGSPYTYWFPYDSNNSKSYLY